MTLFIFAIAVALATALAARAAVRGQLVATPDSASRSHKLRPIDIPALRNLIDASQDHYLRQHLPSADFRRVQRARTRAVLGYVILIAHNAAVLIQIAELARNSEDLGSQAVASDIAHTALTVRMYALLAMCKLSLSLLVPFPSSSNDLLQAYDRLQHRLSLSRLAQGTVVVDRLA